MKLVETICEPMTRSQLGIRVEEIAKNEGSKETRLLVTVDTDRLDRSSRFYEFNVYGRAVEELDLMFKDEIVNSTKPEIRIIGNNRGTLEEASAEYFRRISEYRGVGTKPVDGARNMSINLTSARPLVYTAATVVGGVAGLVIGGPTVGVACALASGGVTWGIFQDKWVQISDARFYNAENINNQIQNHTDQ